MAIIRSKSGEVISGSIGNITYRNHNGKTIVSQRITSNSSKTPKQVATWRAFGEMSRLATNLDEINRIGFDRVKYGTSRNQFISANKELSNYYKTQNCPDSDIPPIYNLCMALGDPLFLGQVITAEGTVNLQSTFQADGEGMLSGEVKLSRMFEVGDRITVAIALAYQRKDDCNSITYYQEKTLNEKDLEELIDPYTFRFDGETFPITPFYRRMSKGSKLAGVIATAIVSGATDKSMGRFSVVSREGIE